MKGIPCDVPKLVPFTRITCGSSFLPDRSGHSLLAVLALFILFSIMSAARAENWIKDAKGCKAFNERPEPGETVTWTGFCAGGWMEGDGEFQFFNNGNPGSRYAGTMRGGKFDGPGVLHLRNGERFEGVFEDGQLRRGKVWFSNGSRYEGELRNWQPHGRGTLFARNGAPRAGEFINGELKDNPAVAGRTADGNFPTDLAIARVKGDGSRKLFLFADPDCPFCQRFERELERVTNVTVYLFLFPLGTLHPGAPEMSRRIWCAPDRARAWEAYMLQRALPGNSGNCDNPINQIAALAGSMNINGTPTLFFEDGRRFAGALSAGQVETFLAQASDGRVAPVAAAPARTEPGRPSESEDRQKQAERARRAEADRRAAAEELARECESTYETCQTMCTATSLAIMAQNPGRASQELSRCSSSCESKQQSCNAGKQQTLTEAVTEVLNESNARQAEQLERQRAETRRLQEEAGQRRQREADNRRTQQQQAAARQNEIEDSRRQQDKLAREQESARQDEAARRAREAQEARRRSGQDATNCLKVEKSTSSLAKLQFVNYCDFWINVVACFDTEDGVCTDWVGQTSIKPRDRYLMLGFDKGIGKRTGPGRWAACKGRGTLHHVSSEPFKFWCERES